MEQFHRSWTKNGPVEHELGSTVYTLHRWVHRGVITGSYTIHGSMGSLSNAWSLLLCTCVDPPMLRNPIYQAILPSVRATQLPSFFTATVSLVRRSHKLFIGYNWNDMLEWYFIFWMHLDSVASATIHSPDQLRRNSRGIRNLAEPPHGLGVRDKYDERTGWSESMSLVFHSFIHNVHNSTRWDGSVRTHGHATHQTAMKAIRNYYRGKRKIYICISKTDYK